MMICCQEYLCVRGAWVSHVSSWIVWHWRIDADDDAGQSRVEQNAGKIPRATITTSILNVSKRTEIHLITKKHTIASSRVNLRRGLHLFKFFTQHDTPGVLRNRLINPQILSRFQHLSHGNMFLWQRRKQTNVQLTLYEHRYHLRENMMLISLVTDS